MQRESRLAEMELMYVYALRCKAMPCGSGSPFFTLLLEYIDLFHDKFDVLDDLRPYLLLLSSADVIHVRDMFRDRVKQAEIRELEPISLVKADGNYAIGSHLNQTVEQDFDK